MLLMKIVIVVYSVNRNDINCIKNEVELWVKSERKVLCLKCDR